MAVVVHVVRPLRFLPEGYEIMERAIARGMIVRRRSGPVTEAFRWRSARSAPQRSW